MHVRGAAVLLASVLCVVVLAAPERAQAQTIAARNPLPPDITREARTPAGAKAFLPLLVKNVNTNAEARIGLYNDGRVLDESGVEAFRRTAGDETPAPLKTRLIQLVFKAAYDLGATRIVIVSSIRTKDRKGRGGLHTTGAAVDFQLPGVPARKLASYLRSLPRVGVGIYTHPKTQYVHLDVRDQSYHWLDGSPPGRTWKEAPLKDAKREERDAAYKPSDNLPG